MDSAGATALRVIPERPMIGDIEERNNCKVTDCYKLHAFSGASRQNRNNTSRHAHPFFAIFSDDRAIFAVFVDCAIAIIKVV
ncbi:unnamed protein product [Lasius platythorax]|uniref:Uncharacterized protein n=1 Tax=Lasius platythorax TaxID=488582 RepID=A0AAV2NQF0_9HYME